MQVIKITILYWNFWLQLSNYFKTSKIKLVNLFTGSKEDAIIMELKYARQDFHSLNGINLLQGR